MSNEENENVPALPTNEMAVEGFHIRQMYTSTSVFEHIQRVSKVFASSDLVPDTYKGKVGNCIIAMEMAMRLDVPTLMFMQNSYLVHGKPALDGKFVIALANQRGPYIGGIKFEYKGDGDTRSCTAIGIRKDGTKDVATVDVPTAKAMGWWEKNKLWRGMTDQMLAYRSATWLARKHCPEVMCGLSTDDEVQDVIDVSPTPIDRLNNKLKT